MLGRDVPKEDEVTLREIIRTIDKKLDHTIRDGPEAHGPRFTLHLTLQNWDADTILSIEDLHAAKNDIVRRNLIRQKIKRVRDHMDDSRFLKDVLGAKSARLLRETSRPEQDFHNQGLRRSPRR